MSLETKLEKKHDFGISQQFVNVSQEISLL